MRRLPQLHIFAALCGLTLLSTAQPLHAADAPATQPSPYSKAIQLLVAGDQRSAEQAVTTSIKNAAKAKQNPDVDEVFLLAVMVRSRFEIRRADKLFAYVNNHAPTTIHGKASFDILQMDASQDGPPPEFVEVGTFSQQEPIDPLLVWVMGIECRQLNLPEEGVKYYSKLCKLWNPGPVLLHQTFANVLDDSGKSDEALVHRKIAIKLEPAAWAYDGLGNTLTALKRWEEADDAYSHSTELAPDTPLYWTNWSHSQLQRGNTDAAMHLAEQAKIAEEGEKNPPAVKH